MTNNKFLIVANIFVALIVITFWVLIFQSETSSMDAWEIWFPTINTINNFHFDKSLDKITSLFEKNSNSFPHTKAVQIEFNHESKGSVESEHGDILGNSIWWGATQLAWNAFQEKFTKWPVELDTTDTDSLETLQKLNTNHFNATQIDDASYYVYAGGWPNALADIKDGVSSKFDNETPTLPDNLWNNDYIVYALLKKALKYNSPFKTETTRFFGQEVEGIETSDNDQRENVIVMKYVDDDNFIIKIRLQDENDELILAKGYDMENSDVILKDIRENSKEQGTIHEDEYFAMPKLHVNYRAEYPEITNIFIKNSILVDPIYIKKMVEAIQFKLDEEGVIMRQEVEIYATAAAVMEMPERQPRQFILDKPFYVIMKRKDTTEPYFILGVNNTKIMYERK